MRSDAEAKGLVSIIMAAYNAEATISMSVESVLSQTYPNFELLIVNDHSTDRTLDIVSQYDDSRIRIISNAQNMGVSQTRHKAIMEAKGEWIAILDSDDLWEKDKLEKQFKRQVETNGDFFFTASSFLVNGKMIPWILEVPETIRYRKLLKQNLISNSSVMIRKSIYKKYEVIADGIHEDYAIWLKALKDGVVAYGINEPLLIYRLSAESKTGNKFKSLLMNWSTFRIIGMGFFESIYYMLWYIFNGIRKYRHIM